MKKDVIALWNISPELLKDCTFNSLLVKSIISDIETGKLITSPNKLDISGFDLMELGLKDKGIADMKAKLFDLVIMNLLSNEKETLLKNVNLLK